MRSIEDIPPPSTLRDPVPASERAEKYGEPLHAIIAKIRSGIIAGAYENGNWYVENSSSASSSPRNGEPHCPERAGIEQQEVHSESYLPRETKAQRIVTFISFLILFLVPILGGKGAFGQWFADKATGRGVPLWGFMAGGALLTATFLYVDRHDLRQWHRLPFSLKMHHASCVFVFIVFVFCLLLTIIAR